MGRLASGELERLVLEVLWANPAPMTPREVHRQLTQRRRLAYTTVTTVLTRLCDKELLERHPAGRAYAYRARVSSDERAADRMAEALVAAADPSLALTHFVNALPPEQVAGLRRALKQARTSH